MRYIRKIPKGRGLNEPILHGDHARPVTRRQMLSAGLISGAASVIVPRMSHADVLANLAGIGSAACGISGGAGRIPFICFDLSGGANIAGSNVLIGGPLGQQDFLTTAGYSKLGLPGNMTPNLAGQINSEYTLLFHTDSSFLRGMNLRTAVTTRALTNGTIIAARSENDTGNNPHNPMYGIARTGAKGELLTLIGSTASDSGGNSMAPIMMIDPKIRPTKVDRGSDVSGLVDTGELGTLFSNPADAVSVMESMAVLSKNKHDRISTGLTAAGADDELKKFNKCGYIKSAYLAEEFGSSSLDPGEDPLIVSDAGGIFTTAEYMADREFQKTAAVMKTVIDGNAGAGTIQMGGFDYHTGDRSTGEVRDLRAGNCIGACLEYAARKGKPLMIYVFSDGSLSSNGMIDNSINGRGKGVWTGDNQATAASFFLVFNPGGRPTIRTAGNQIGWYSGDGSVVTTSSPAANAVNQLVETVILNYMALHDMDDLFANLGYFPSNGLGANRDRLIAFQPIAPRPAGV